MGSDHPGRDRDGRGRVFAGHWGDGAPRGSLGSPLPGYDVAVVDERGTRPDGYAGELAVRGGTPPLFAGYWNAPDATKAAYRGDWFVTGDVAVRDEEGFIWLDGRREYAAPRAFEPFDVTADEPPAPEPVVERAVPVPAPDRRPVAPAPTPEPPSVPAASTASAQDKPAKRPYFARLTATLWLLAAGVLIGGVAIPHAQDSPRVVPKSEDVPNAICLTRSSRR